MIVALLLFSALLSGIMYKNGVKMALQGSPTHRYFLSGQKSRLADLVCAKHTRALISRYFFFTDLRQYGGCAPRYFTVVSCETWNKREYKMRNVFQMRDPLTRFHSRYRFNREILPRLHNRKMIREARNRSRNINECVEQNHVECDYSGTLPRQT